MPLADLVRRRGEFPEKPKPCRVRVAVPIRRAMTQLRSAESASLLVSGNSG